VVPGAFRVGEVEGARHGLQSEEKKRKEKKIPYKEGMQKGIGSSVGMQPYIGGMGV
jgi:hypothetical protein